MEMFNNHLLNTGEILYSPVREVSSFQDEQSVLSNNYFSTFGTNFSSFPSARNVTSSASDVLLPNIFVQIPIHNSQPHSNNKQNSEIKSELIKSEIDNPAVSGTSQTNLVQTATTIASSLPATNVCLQQAPVLMSTSLVTARPKAGIKCFKCTCCPFISISQTGLDLHIENCHQNNCFDSTDSAKKKLVCPGCDNVFYSKKSLKIHLVNDHQMSITEIKVLLQSLLSESGTDDEEQVPTAVETNNKQKIYLKNVEILKNPTFTSNETTNEGYLPYTSFNEDLHNNQDIAPIEQYDDDPNDVLIDLIDDEFNEEEDDEVIEEIPTDFQNKIYVKNDNILKKPDVLEQQFTFSHNNFEYNNVQQHFSVENQVLNIIETPPPPPTPQISFTPVDQIFQSNFQNNEATRKPCKIFIKNVDILKKPMFLQSSGSNSLSPQPQQFFNNNLTTTNRLGTIPSFNGNVNDFPFTFASSPARYLDNATPISNQQKKICIKNIDILKEPEATPEIRKNMLHLRTVDELNLMNINEVQNLIENYQEEEVTNHENQNSSIANEDYDEIPEYLNNKNCGGDDEQCLESAIQDFVTNYQSDEGDKFKFPIQTGQQNSENSFENSNNIIDFESNPMNFNNDNETNNLVVFDNVIDSTTSSIDEKANKTELNNENNTSETSQMYYSNFPGNCQRFTTKIITNPETLDYEKAFNEDILFVCAEEIINSTNFIENDSVENTQIICDQLTENIEVLDDSETKRMTSSNTHSQSRGRIYVVGNLMKESTGAEVVSETVEVEESNDETYSTVNNENLVSMKDTTKRPRKPKKHIGRPKGLRKITAHGNLKDENQNPKEALYQCKLDCAMRFQDPEILKFHEKCHDPVQKNKIICPECQQSDFKIWNTLHTHLWRQHEVDMELYHCEQCLFKTPILSRLLNTHMKIHSDERNFKCDQCEKAFKNAKQLKNHRRVHSQVVVIRKCDICDILFYSQKHLRNHIRSIHEKQDEYKCSICDCVFSSVIARQTHILNHINAEKYKCQECPYTSNDNNAYRRHKMTHNKNGSYSCPYCVFTSIQSTTYKKHVLKTHPTEAKEIIFSCNECKFITINKRRYELHLLNHDSNKLHSSDAPTDTNDDNSTLVQRKACDIEDKMPFSIAVKNSKNESKIKVKSNLTLI